MRRWDRSTPSRVKSTPGNPAGTRRSTNRDRRHGLKSSPSSWAVSRRSIGCTPISITRVQGRDEPCSSGGTGARQNIPGPSVSACPSSLIVWIAVGQCVQRSGRGEPYLPVVEGLGRLVRDSRHRQASRSSSATRHRGWTRYSIVRFPPAYRPVRNPRSNSGQMAGELTHAIEALTAVKPLVLVLEDLHWSDHRQSSSSRGWAAGRIMRGSLSSAPIASPNWSTWDLRCCASSRASRALSGRRDRAVALERGSHRPIHRSRQNLKYNVRTQRRASNIGVAIRCSSFISSSTSKAAAGCSNATADGPWISEAAGAGFRSGHASDAGREIRSIGLVSNAGGCSKSPASSAARSRRRSSHMRRTRM